MVRLGDYELEDEIGRGGMGRVYRARHVPTGAHRAVKVIAGANDPEAILRFRREAEALARVGPEIAVTVHQAGHEGGRTYFVMELLSGGSLAGRIARGKLPWRDSVLLVAKIAAAVARCHEAGVVHRDLKPANVLFDEHGKPRLVDFGCARDLAASTLTETGTALGTPGYMAPEQLDGARGDARSDVYALGVMLHELVTGARPHRGRTWRDLLLEAQKGLPAPVAAEAGAPLALDRLLARALTADPARRTASASALVRELEAVQAGEPRFRVPARIAAAFALVLVIGGGAALVLPSLRGEAAAPPGAGAGLSVVVLDEPARKRLHKGTATASELAALVRSRENAALLRDLVVDAVVFDPAVAREASAAESGSEDLALLEAIATLGSSTADVERAPARARIAAAKRGGSFDCLRAALHAARAAIAAPEQGWDRELSLGARADAGVLGRALEPLAKRPELVAAVAAELDSSSRADVVALFADLVPKPLQDVLRAAPVLQREGVFERLSPHVAIASIAFLDPHRREELERGDPDRPRLCETLERAARDLEAKDPLLAGYALASASFIGGFASPLPSVVADTEGARRLLFPFTRHDDLEAFFAVHSLLQLDEREALDAAARANVERRRPQILERGLAAASDGDRIDQRYAELLATSSLKAFEDHERRLPGQAVHFHALFLLALDRDATTVTGLLDDDLLRLARSEHPDRARVESEATRILVDRRMGKRVPDFLVRSACSFLAHVQRLRGDEAAAEATDAVRSGLEGVRQLDGLETLVARKRLP